MDESLPARAGVLFESPALAQLFASLQQRGFEIVGPTVRDGAIILDTLESPADLPSGWTHDAEPGQYRLRKRKDHSVFGYAVGPQSLKKYLHPSEVTVHEGRLENGVARIVRNIPPPPKRAFLGVRPCDLAALGIHDRIFLGDRFVDGGYRARRGSVFLVAVNCTEPAGTCFCTSFDTGPAARSGFDLLLTELGPKEHGFLAEPGTAAGSEILAEIPSKPAGDRDYERRDAALAHAAANIRRRLDTQGLKELLYENFENPRWEQTAARCLSCANCTMSCPTCFCTTIEDTTTVAGGQAVRRRKWDSCFTESFSYIHGGSVRLSVKSRYRQWLTHKLAAWVDQFGRFGCVGCGRCIAWCPARIDLTEEVAAIRNGERRDGNENAR